MLFNSLDFAIFLPLAFSIYWLLPAERIRLRNAFLVLASYVFYGWWDWRFLSLIVISTVVDYVAGLSLGRSHQAGRRRFWLGASLATNLGVLFTFKYFGFFVDTFASAFRFAGQPISVPSLHLVLPVGISFYTFQTLSYTIDVYRRRVPVCRDPLAFFAYVSFFPQLVAGPIERAGTLLPQFYDQKTFSYPYAVDGLRLILWGLFKKVVIADNCAEYVNRIFEAPGSYGSSELWLGTLLFSFQIYCDFSGYSDIAIGTAKLFGFRLRRNFLYPYFARDIAEFWRRWHVSLSTWFRDYLYIPLGGSKCSAWLRVRNVFIVFCLSGLWHGANWTFLVWGALHATLFLPLLLIGWNRSHLEHVPTQKIFPSLREAGLMLLNFLAVSLCWIPFRAQSLGDAAVYVRRAFTEWSMVPTSYPSKSLLVFILLMLVFEWVHRDKDHPLQVAGLPKGLRWSVYYLLVMVIYLYGNYQSRYAFIYFQF